MTPPSAHSDEPQPHSHSARAANPRPTELPRDAAPLSRLDPDNPHDGSGPPRSCPRKWMGLVLAAIAMHSAAVVAEPLRFFSQSDFQAGPEFVWLRQRMAPYVEWLYLDHGYFFFAPNPGPNHLVGVRVIPPTTPARAQPLRLGTPIDLERDVDEVFPDRHRQWPRLLYHRYFMLSEFYNNSFAPPALPEEDQKDLLFVDRWRQDRTFYSALSRSIEHAIARKLAVDRVELMRFERALLSSEQVLREGWQLNDPRGLELLPEGLPAGEGTSEEVPLREPITGGGPELESPALGPIDGRTPLGPWRPRRANTSIPPSPPIEVLRP
jgi:hypothetical protein